MSKEQINFLTYTALLNSGGGGDPSNWSSYPSLTAVSMGGNSLNYNSNTSLSPTTLTINSNTTLTNSNLTIQGAPVLYKSSLGFTDSNGSVSLAPQSFTMCNTTSSSPLINLEATFSNTIALLKGTHTPSVGNKNTVEFGIDIGSVYLAGVSTPAPPSSPYLMPMSFSGEGITMYMGSNSNAQLRLDNGNQYGYLWVDSTGALYWNSNLIANA